ncbi:MAG: LysR family transcriptional regulator [Heliomarina sp.]|uniref:LysR family transcriptional regulator n=1 Tax=Heliomarina sp. TaxID=2917556 RepID=UPI00405A1B38
MNYQQIRAFSLVAQEGSVRRASEVLGVSQPTVSQHLKALEQRHGLRLLEKRGRGLVLTDAGRELYSVTKTLMFAAKEVEEFLQRRPSAGNGRLRIVSDSPALAVHIVSLMLEETPDLQISIRKDSVAGVVEAVQDMRADVGIAVDPMIGTALHVQPVKREELWVALPSEDSLSKQNRFPIEMVAQRFLVMREKSSRTRALIERALSLENIQPRRVIEIEGAEVVREAVAKGLGIAFCAGSECPPDHRIAYRRITMRHGKIGFVENVIIRQDRRRVPEIAQFLGAAEKVRSAPVESLKQKK